MQKVQYCVAVLPETGRPNVYFEIGLAVGLAKQVAVFAGRSTSLPNDVADLTYSRADLNDNTAVGKFLDVFLHHSKQRPRTGAGRQQSSHRLTEQEYSTFSRHIAQATGRELEQIVLDVFRKAGYVVSA